MYLGSNYEGIRSNLQTLAEENGSSQHFFLGYVVTLSVFKTVGFLDMKDIDWMCQDHDIDYTYPLVMTNSSPWYRWPIEIDGLPNSNMVIFHGYVSHNQRVYTFSFRGDE